MKLSSLKYLIIEGFKNIWTNRSMALASVGVLTACLVLTGAAALISIDMNILINSITEQNEVTVYLDDDITALDAIDIGYKIQAVDNIDTCKFYSKEEAILEYEDNLGNLYADIEKDNPLPHAFKVSLKDLSLYNSTIEKLSNIDGVQDVSNQQDIARQLTKLRNLIVTIGIWTVIILVIVSLFIVQNTIKMTMYSHRFEISIMKSVGATNAFVRVPFIIEGMLIGIVSAIISIILLMFSYDIILSMLKNIVSLVQVCIPFEDVAIIMTIIFVIAGAIFGSIGASISIRKFLKKEGNELLGW